MRKIIQGVRSFQEQRSKENQDLFLVPAHGQSPRHLVITCSDSRVVPHLIMGLGPVRSSSSAMLATLFLLPLWDHPRGGIIEFAVDELR